MHAQGAVRSGAVDAEEDAVGDAGPARVLGAAVEAGLKAERGRDGLRAPCRSPSPRPSSPAARYLVGRRRPQPPEEGLDLRPARLRRHRLSFPHATAATGGATGAGRAPPAPASEGGQPGHRLPPARGSAAAAREGSGTAGRALRGGSGVGSPHGGRCSVTPSCCLKNKRKWVSAWVWRLSG